jgi:hypothetical protein
MRRYRPILAAAIVLAALLALALPAAVSADMGPKPSITVVAKNMPVGTTVYMDLLVQNEEGSVFANLEDESGYDAALLGILKNYDVGGWTAALAGGTRGPLFSDIVCAVQADGTCTMRFSYFGTPDFFRVIVVSSDGIVVSNPVDRTVFSNVTDFDHASGTAAERLPEKVLPYTFLWTFLGTLLVEGIVLMLFGFHWKSSWAPFLLVNLVTQGVLTLLLWLASAVGGTFVALVVYALMEVAILIAEALLFAHFLKEHSKGRRVAFAIVANLASFAAGVALIYLL